MIITGFFYNLEAQCLEFLSLAVGKKRERVKELGRCENMVE
jgi:hypothetical protein